MPGDPLMPVIDAFAMTVLQLGGEQTALKEIGEATVKKFGKLLAEQREIVRAATDSASQQARNAEAQMLERIAEASAMAASNALSRRARALDCRAAAVVGLCIAIAACVGAFGGYRAGYQAASTTISEEEAALRAGFQNGIDAADLWVDLMRWNDPRAALLNCRRPEEILMQNGRRFCRVRLWVEKPPEAKPY